MFVEVEKPVLLYEESVKKYTYPDLKQQGGQCTPGHYFRNPVSTSAKTESLS